MAATTTKPAQQTKAPEVAISKGQVAVLAPPRLMPPAADTLKKYDVDSEGWRTLTESIFPAAKSVTSVMMALDYCKHRKLDIFKRPVHIVPIWNSQVNDGRGGLVETIWPGIAELRTTAIRTGQYAGMDVPTFGPNVVNTFTGRIKKKNKNGGEEYKEEKVDVTHPEWCQITVYRVLGGNRVPFPGPRVYWLETYARLSNFVDIPNSMWQKRASGQLEKCTEAAALRRAFPEELGNEYAVDEAGAFHTVDVTEQGSATTAPPEPTRETVNAAQAQPIDQDAGKADIGKNPQDTGKAQAAKNEPPHDPETGEIKQQPKQNKAELTDVEDLNDQPITFEAYTKIGDFFTFSDAWLEDPKRTPAEAKQWEEFYRDYIKEKAAHPNPKIREAIAETIGIYSAALAKEQAE